MDILRCRTPAMVPKAIQMHLIVYNALRRLILGSRPPQGIERVSFKARRQALRKCETQLSPDPSKPPQARRYRQLHGMPEVYQPSQARPARTPMRQTAIDFRLA